MLLTKDQKFYWDATLNELFKESNQNIIQKTEKGVKTSEMERVIYLSTDFSKTSIGHVSFQKHFPCPIESSSNCSYWGAQISWLQWIITNGEYIFRKGPGECKSPRSQMYRFRVMIVPDMLKCRTWLRRRISGITKTHQSNDQWHNPAYWCTWS